MAKPRSDRSFFDEVYDVVARVPEGCVVSYGQIARMLGRPMAAREVGWAMSSCPDELPWQRVVMKDGSVSGGECAGLRRSMLVDEGIVFLRDGRVDMSLHAWDGGSGGLAGCSGAAGGSDAADGFQDCSGGADGLADCGGGSDGLADCSGGAGGGRTRGFRDV